MAEGNGKANHMLLPPQDYVVFRIGGQDLQVCALTLWHIDLLMDKLRNFDASSISSSARDIFHVISVVLDDPELTEEVLYKNCSWPEALALTTPFRELLEKSGFITPGEADAATENPGTGTQMPSPQNLQSEESAAATQSE